MTPKEIEQTLVLIKPDALKGSLTGYILSQFSEFHTGLRFAGAKIVHVTRMLAEEHYAEHKGKPFYLPLLSYITGELHYVDQSHRRRVIAFVYYGPDAVKKVREITGPTNPHVARERASGTIRALGTIVPVKDASARSWAIAWTIWSTPRRPMPKRNARSNSGSGRMTSCRTCGRTRRKPATNISISRTAGY